MFFIDSHCHLNMLEEKEDINNIIIRSSEQNVKYLQTICTSLQDINKVINIIDRFDNVYGSIGIHPSEVTIPITQTTEKIHDKTIKELKEFQNNIFIRKHPHLQEIINKLIGNLSIVNTLTFEELVAFSQHPKIIGLGETGLDYYYNENNNDNRKKQISSFLSHINAAAQTNLPLIVHTREAEKDTLEILSAEMKNNPYQGLIHCFTASKEFAKKMLDLGLYISFSGIITFKNATDLQDIVNFVPLERMLIETDSPYLAPVPMRGKTNEPAYVKYVADKVAEIKKITIKEVAEATSNNFFNLFNKVKL